ncbi:MAG: CHAD domain-containing protein [Erythrobacter sp.]|uniref:CHAD domain-containing protein n=1 Tax=Erythrobacter sp. TaxID=1042 RepID=UPI0032EB019C
MTYCFDAPGGIGRQVRAIADYQIGAALAELDRPDEQREDIVHAVRLRCKKLRGLIRLVRPAFEPYKDENAAFRHVSHLFAELRDAKVMQDTYDLVLGAFDEQVERGAFAGVRRELTRRRKALLARTDWAALCGEARERLGAARERASDWRIEGDGWGAIAPGIAKTHGRAVKAMAKATDEPTGDTHHEWRKRAKYHRYHTRLVKHAFEQALAPRADTLHHLTGLLGDHHDIHVLAEALDEDPDAFGDERTLALLASMAERRAADLSARAHALGTRLFAEETDALVERWGRWWKAWESECEPARVA